MIICLLQSYRLTDGSYKIEANRRSSKLRQEHERNGLKHRKKRTAILPEQSPVLFLQIDAELIRTIRDAVSAMRSLFEGKLAALSRMVRPGSDSDSPEARAGATEIGELDQALTSYNKLAAPASAPNLSQQSRRQLLMATHELLKPVSVLVNGLKQAAQGYARDITRTKSSDSLNTSATLYFVRCVEALNFYNVIREQIMSGSLTIIDDEVLRPRLWDLINKNAKWKEIAGRKNVDQMFRSFLGKSDEGVPSLGIGKLTPGFQNTTVQQTKEEAEKATPVGYVGPSRNAPTVHGAPQPSAPAVVNDEPVEMDQPARASNPINNDDNGDNDPDNGGDPNNDGNPETRTR